MIGEPFLDKYLIKRLKAVRKKYSNLFFCTPATMTVDKAVEAMENGLTVLKFSLDAMDDEKIKKIRGKKANYNESIEKIFKLIEIKKKKNLKTLLVPCMIAFDKKEESINLHEKFLNFWKDEDVYAYVKSHNNRRCLEQDKDLKTCPTMQRNIVNFHGHQLRCTEGNVVPCTQISNIK